MSFVVPDACTLPTVEQPLRPAAEHLPAAFIRLGRPDVRVHDGGKAGRAGAGLPFDGTRATPKAA